MAAMGGSRFPIMELPGIVPLVWLLACAPAWAQLGPQDGQSDGQNDGPNAETTPGPAAAASPAYETTVVALT